ncbi:MAG: hypothetical protein IJ168_02140 [Eubacterium sp.]|nr:hypothetical protein [Eubacterium sp.]
MVDIIYTKGNNPSGFCAANSEAEDIAGYITAKLIDIGVAQEAAEYLTEDVVSWCQTANNGDEYTELAEYGFEIYSYDESLSAQKTETLIRNSKSIANAPVQERSTTPLSIRDKLQSFKNHHSALEPNEYGRGNTDMEVEL